MGGEMASYLVTDTQKKYFAASSKFYMYLHYMYMCNIVVQNFNSNELKIVKTGFVVNCTNFKGKHRKKIAAANRNS